MKCLSATYIRFYYCVTENTARLFKRKVHIAMSSRGNNLMNGNVHVDEFLIGGKEDDKIARI